MPVALFSLFYFAIRKTRETFSTLLDEQNNVLRELWRVSEEAVKQLGEAKRLVESAAN
jgi:hypothetical protein